MVVQQKYLKILTPADWWIVFGTLSVLAGGLLSAAYAHDPSRIVMWASAYLVLAAGIVQVAFGLLLKKLTPLSDMRNLYTALVLYNVGGVGVIIGTALKTSVVGPTLLVLSEAFLALALAAIFYSVRGAKPSKWLVAIYILLGVMFVSMLVGLILSTLIHLS
jgi:drug/metabolite transporter (DMT)-like permease